MHVAAVARVPPTRLQLIVAPECGGLEGPAAAGLDVPGLEMGLAKLGSGWRRGEEDSGGDAHSVVGRDDGVVGVDEGALAAGDGDGGLQAADGRGGVEWAGDAAYGVGGLASVLGGFVSVKRRSNDALRSMLDIQR